MKVFFLANAVRIESQWSLTLEVRKSGGVLSKLGEGIASQWSLTLEVRKRRKTHDHQHPSSPVAMEPDLGGQEKVGDPLGGRLVISVAMEPDLGGQEKITWAPPQEIDILVAMEPDLGGQEKMAALLRARSPLGQVAMEPDLGGQEKPAAPPRG